MMKWNQVSVKERADLLIRLKVLIRKGSELTSLEKMVEAEKFLEKFDLIYEILLRRIGFFHIIC